MLMKFIKASAFFSFSFSFSFNVNVTYFDAKNAFSTTLYKYNFHMNHFEVDFIHTVYARKFNLKILNAKTTFFQHLSFLLSRGQIIKSF